MLTTADGRSLKAALAASHRKARWRAFMLVAPLLAFLLLTFLAPIAQMISKSVTNPEIAEAMPRTAKALGRWDGASDLPPEAVFAALREDMVEDAKLAKNDQSMGRAAGRINREIPGSKSAILGVMRKAEKMEPPYADAFVAANAKWADPELWSLMKRESRTITPAYYLLAVDMEYGSDGQIQSRAPEMQVYVGMFWRTAWMSMLITAICIVLAYPVAYMLATQPLRTANVLMILVLLPFWTSLLVRTSAWIVLLQREGVLNDLFVFFGFVSDEGRVRMIYNATGTIIAMVHILLPFMILPLFSVMKTIKPSYMRAAVSMGAHPFSAWWKVYFPLTLPGMAAGVLLVFILAIGYYITPALVGGESGIFISNLIAKNMQAGSAQLRLAAALATILLVAVLLLYWIFNKLVGVDKLKFG